MGIAMMRWAALGLMVLLLPGCWDVVDINDRTPALAIGFDYTPKSDSWSLTLDDVTLDQQAGRYTDHLETASGSSLLTTLETLRSKVSRRLYLGSVKVFAFGSGIDGVHLTDALSMLRAHNEVNIAGYTLAVDGSAESLLASPDGASGVMAVRLQNQFERSQAYRDGHLLAPLWEGTRRMMTPGSAIYMPCFKPDPQHGAQAVGTVIYRMQGPRLALDPESSVTLRWLFGKPGRNVLQLGGGRAVKVISASQHVVFHEATTAQAAVTVSAVAEAYDSPIFSTAQIELLQQEAAKEMVARITRVLDTLQSHGADVLEWGKKARQQGLTSFDLKTVQSTVQVRVRVVPHLAPSL